MKVWARVLFAVGLLLGIPGTILFLAAAGRDTTVHGVHDYSPRMYSQGLIQSQNIALALYGDAVIVGAIFFVGGLILFALLPDQRLRCSHCLKEICKGALVCPHCLRAIAWPLPESESLPTPTQ